jgi:GNAT superfamily N-acetyltransferase
VDELRISFEPFPADAASRFIVDGVDNHNIAATGQAAWFPANFLLQSGRGEVLGGLLGTIWGGWLHVRVLWVAEPVRSRGHGGRLLRAAEGYACERDCIGATLETHSPKALGLYLRHGYTVFGTIADYPPGHSKHFLSKALPGRQ